MIAQFIDYNDETIALCMVRPNRSTHPKISLSFPSDVATHPISKVESRRTFAGSARCVQTYLATLRTAADCTEFRIWLNQLKTQLVAAPVWDDGCALTTGVNTGAQTLSLAMHPVRSGAEWIIATDDNSVWEIVTVDDVTTDSVHLAAGVANNWPAGSVIYPLMFGRLVDRPEVTSITPGRGSFTLTLKENSPYARRLNQFPVDIATVGAQVAELAALPLWTIEPTYSRVLDRTEIDAVYNEIGFGREDAERDFGEAVARGLELSFYCRSRDAIAQLESFFVNRLGLVGSFAMATYRNDLELAQDLPIGGTPRLIKIKASEYSDAGRTPHPGDPFIAIVDAAGVDPHRITDVAAGNLTTAADVVQAHSSATARLSALLVGRLVDPTLDWEYITPERAKATLKFIERPNEYANPAPVMKQPALLFIFIEKTKYPQIWLFTNYEKAITIANGPYAGTYIPAPFSVSGMKRSLQPDSSSFSLKSSDFAGNPLKRFFPPIMEGPMYLTVLRANAADLTEAPRYLSSGRITNVKPTLESADAVRWGRMMDQKLPAFLLSTTDNAGIDSAALGINLATFKITGPISYVNGAEIHVTSGPAAAKAADYFANGGWIEIGTTPTTYESRGIFHSETIAGGVKLILDRPLIRNGVAASVDMYPGYDGNIDTLETKFNARANHLGHPFVPDSSPGIRGVQTKQTAGGKGK